MAIKEAFFAAGQDILRPVKTMIADSYPNEQRERLSSHFNEEVLREYDRVCKRASSFLYEQRNIVQSKWLPRYNITRRKPNEPPNEDFAELRNCLVDNCLDRLSELLIANSPLLVKRQYIEQLQMAVEKATEAAKTRLSTYLQAFQVSRKDGYAKLSEVYEF